MPRDAIVRRLEVDADCHGWRLDRFIQYKIRRLSRERIQRILIAQVTIDGVPADKPARRVASGSVILIHRPAPDEPEVPRTFDVLYEDDAMLAIDKPAGLPMHPTARYYHNTLTALLRERYPGAGLQIAHRLDKETSGILLVARGTSAGRSLKQSFEKRLVKKSYLAIVRGAPREDAGLIELPLELDPKASVKVKMRLAQNGGLVARTRFCVLERRSQHALLKLEPETGRQHQLRVHLAAIDCPILGDKLYGEHDGERLFRDWCDTGGNADMLERLGHWRQALHAHEIIFPHPVSGLETSLVAPFAADLAALWRRLSSP